MADRRPARLNDGDLDAMERRIRDGQLTPDGCRALALVLLAEVRDRRAAMTLTGMEKRYIADGCWEMDCDEAMSRLTARRWRSIIDRITEEADRG